MIKIKDVNINYLDYGKEKGKTIVLLHGWGQNVEMMDMLGKPFANSFRIINIDLPGFGKSEEPSAVWDLDDYVEMVELLLKELKVKNPILVGHSFGGRVAIKFASIHDTAKVVLLGSPFRPSGKKSLKTKILKFLKRVPLLNKLEGWAKTKLGSRDYRNASEIMRGVLVKAINEDLTDNAKHIKAPVLIIFGDQDAEVPVSEAEVLEKLINNAGLVVYPGCTHYAYLERLNQTIAVLKEFFK